MDVFLLGGDEHAISSEELPGSRFQVEIVNPDGSPIHCANGLTISPHKSIHEAQDAQLIIVSGLWDVENVLANHQETIRWLAEQYQKGVNIASICTGAFVLAATGLLDGKDATTHWSAADVFRQLFPQVNLRPERLITDVGDLFCAGAFSACFDLSLYLVAKLAGYDMAARTAKMLIHDIGRVAQTPYFTFNYQRNHNDSSILQVQKKIEQAFSHQIDFNELSSQSGMSKRTLERRFKTATGDTPLKYLQRVRVEAAKKKLEETNSSFDEISYEVGYEDSSFFRKIFIKQTSLQPREYRLKFKRNWTFRA